nr:unnamed protein product [Callosobruchus chinensis]
MPQQLSTHSGTYPYLLHRISTH